ncbi:hypothetical protein Htur_4627 (plasmid) [Haloterrigena turkmenica DSM 5511]|uniref:Uncharacterized protein n=1 Tax=Haloterrigena turkmenica (strain ATCC 51198 / DSM 5511 / JCM 9101 / NCIMB 13204 / VKM B-1734 / 4k) TaxID=543526 RepID=D2S216_HALTV|nr:hypothetical protein Htur_4627 [Haloterrigena turkmenica DSM 5511]
MPSYDDSDFPDLLETVNWAPAYRVVNCLGCTFRIANRQLI